MIFRAQVGTLYRYCCAIPLLYLCTITVTIVILLWLLWFIILYRPIQQRISAYHAALLHDKQQSIMRQKHDRACTLLQEQLCTLQSSLLQQCHAGKEITFDRLLHICDATTTICHNLQFGTKQKEDWYCKQPLSVQLQGTLSALISFLSHIHQQNILMTLKTVQINQQNTDLYTGNFVFDCYTALASDTNVTATLYSKKEKQ